jgi:two-component system OmpR family response regulator
MPSKILVVDDDAHIREVVQFALEKAGLEAVEAGNGQKALELFSRSNPDLVILDITMPEMDGLAVCREIRKNSDTPILFLSSRADEVDRVVGLEIGGDDYVTKPS